MQRTPRLRSQPEQLSTEFKAAISEMVWSGADMKQAAKAVGITIQQLRNALDRPHVKQRYLRELEVLRSSARARSVHRLLELREGENGQVAIAAIRTLERMEEDADRRPPGAQHGPGLQIVIVQGPAPVQDDCKTITEVAAAE